MVTMLIIVVLVTAGAVALGTMRAADADTTANVLASAMRYVATLSVHYNKTYRLVIDLDGHRWWVEAADSDDPCARFVPDDADPPKEGATPVADTAPDEDGLADSAVAATATYAKEDAELLDGEFEPDTTVSAVLTSHHQEPQTSGKVAIYFYPNGQVERAFVWVAEEKEQDGVVTADPEITLSLGALGSVERIGNALPEEDFYREAAKL